MSCEQLQTTPMSPIPSGEIGKPRLYSRTYVSGRKDNEQKVYYSWDRQVDDYNLPLREFHIHRYYEY